MLARIALLSEGSGFGILSRIPAAIDKQRRGKTNHIGLDSLTTSVRTTYYLLHTEYIYANVGLCTTK